eukprot:966941-Alexandrium_andersonii.AAC.1
MKLTARHKSSCVSLRVGHWVTDQHAARAIVEEPPRLVRLHLAPHRGRRVGAARRDPRARRCSDHRAQRRPRWGRGTAPLARIHRGKHDAK